MSRSSWSRRKRWRCGPSRKAATTIATGSAYAFRLCTARRPSAARPTCCIELLAKEDQRIADGWIDARELAGLAGELKAAASRRRHAAQLAAWTAVSRVILNLDETITKE